MMKRILLASASAMALAGTSMAADLTPPPVLPPPPPPPTWTGFYAGINAGYQWSASNNVDVLSVPTSGVAGVAGVTALANGNVGVSENAFIGGGQIGYNYQFANSWVAGLEADFDGLTTSHPAGTVGTFGSVLGVPVTTSLSATKNLDYLGTVRGRLGYLVTPTLLVYGTGGFAYGGASTNFAIAQYTPAALLGFAAGPGISEAAVGWTAGGGIEWQFMPNWSAKVEYLYYDLGSLTSRSILTTGTFNYALSEGKTTFTGNVVRAGLDYHFNWGWPAPVVAKY